ncbi:hypothetical protein TNCV_4732431 [Trichonephila clavipes]|nr:hypothetical protein TNCV_4732431 [Trichonephila clavipes]
MDERRRDRRRQRRTKESRGEREWSPPCMEKRAESGNWRKKDDERRWLLCEGETRNRWRDVQVCPDVGQGTMAPWARRLGREKKSGENGRKEKGEETAKEKERESGRERAEPALYGEKG